MNQLMTNQMREEMAERELAANGGAPGLAQAMQRAARLQKQEKFLKAKLQRDIKKRNNNRRKNKAARRARRNQRYGR